MTDKADVLLDCAVADFVLVAQNHAVPSLLVGAYARDILLQQSSCSRLPRRTEDVDLAVMVASWQDFLKLRSSLLASQKFEPASNAQGKVLHKLLYRGQIEIDFIPFGELAPEGELRCWPDDFHQQMDVSGFADALKTAEKIDVCGCQISVITAEAFVMLKLLAWNDCQNRVKDAKDILFMFKEYENFPRKIDALWEPENFDLTEHLLHDHNRRIVRLLGRNIAKCFHPKINRKACEILTRECDGNSIRLASQMGIRDIENCLELISDLRDGIQDIIFH